MQCLFDPYHTWLGIPPEEQPPNHYRLLGLTLFESNTDVIRNASDQRMAYLKSLSTGSNSKSSQDLLDAVSKATVCLLKHRKKTKYDTRLRQSLGKPETAKPPEAILATLPSPGEESISALCPNCEEIVSYNLAKSGQPVPCPNCSDPFQTPSFEQLLMDSQPAPTSDEEEEPPIMINDYATSRRVGGKRRYRSHQRSGRRKRKSAARLMAEILLGGVGGIAVAIALLYYIDPDKSILRPFFDARRPQLVLKTRNLKTLNGKTDEVESGSVLRINEGKEVTVKLSVEDSDYWDGRLRYELDGVGKVFNNEYRWDADNNYGKENDVTIRVIADGNESLSDQKSFSIIVKEISHPPEVKPIDDQKESPPEIQVTDNIDSLELDLQTDQLPKPIENQLDNTHASDVESFKPDGSDELIVTEIPDSIDVTSDENHDRFEPQLDISIKRALRWITDHQLSDGGWNFDHKVEKCDRQCGNDGSMVLARNAATALAVLCLMGADKSYKEGDYKKAIDEGLNFLSDRIKQHRSLYEPKGTMYSHALGTMALCEGCRQTRSSRLRRSAKQAISFIQKTQDLRKGGWRYMGNDGSDTSVTGWQVTALTCGKNAGIIIHPKCIKGVVNFLNYAQIDGESRYGYLRPDRKNNTTTAVGLASRIKLGWRREKPALQRGAMFLSDLGPLEGQIYHNFYAHQVLLYCGGPKWDAWRKKMYESLLNQQATGGHADGSWWFNTNDWGNKDGGRLYCTAMATLVLEMERGYLSFFPKPGVKHIDGEGEN